MSIESGAGVSGPLAGIRVVEFSGIGPGPFAGMLLADMGAEVLAIDRPGAPPVPILSRGKAVVALDLKDAEAQETARAAVAAADILIEGFRPGVMERLGFGPDAMIALNPRLVYARMTGWGQDGPAAQTAGHDLSYIAVTGALAAMGPPDRPPPPPLNLVGDFGGGSLYLVMGICAALVERAGSGRGQVIDAAIIDGTASLMASLFAFSRFGFSFERGESILGGASPYYRCYRCADGLYIAAAALEPAFYAELLAGLDLDPAALPDRDDPAAWPALEAIFTARFSARTRDDWATHFAKGDACVSPVLTMAEAARHPQVAARASYIVRDGLTQPAPAPRFSRTPSTIGSPGDLMRRWEIS